MSSFKIEGINRYIQTVNDNKIQFWYVQGKVIFIHISEREKQF